MDRDTSGLALKGMDLETTGLALKDMDLERSGLKLKHSVRMLPDRGMPGKQFCLCPFVLIKSSVL